MGYGLLAVLQRSRAERVQHGLHEDRAAPPEGGHAFGEEAGASGRQGHLSPTRQQPVRHTRQQAAQPESPTAAMEVTMAVLRSPDLKQYPQVHESLWDVHEGTTFSRQSLPDGAGASLGFRGKYWEDLGSGGTLHDLMLLVRRPYSNIKAAWELEEQISSGWVDMCKAQVT